ncbi:MAG: hypothetical protein QOF11_570, partial [Chloroflexota bacterium]|nr:hypothetical protein [Chloroflexota bacterium]
MLRSNDLPDRWANDVVGTLALRGGAGGLGGGLGLGSFGLGLAGSLGLCGGLGLARSFRVGLGGGIGLADSLGLCGGLGLGSSFRVGLGLRLERSFGFGCLRVDPGLLGTRRSLGGVDLEGAIGSRAKVDLGGLGRRRLRLQLALLETIRLGHGSRPLGVRLSLTHPLGLDLGLGLAGELGFELGGEPHPLDFLGLAGGAQPLGLFRCGPAGALRGDVRLRLTRPLGLDLGRSLGQAGDFCLGGQLGGTNAFGLGLGFRMGGNFGVGRWHRAVCRGDVGRRPVGGNRTRAVALVRGDPPVGRPGEADAGQRVQVRERRIENVVTEVRSAGQAAAL